MCKNLLQVCQGPVRKLPGTLPKSSGPLLPNLLGSLSVKGPRKFKFVGLCAGMTGLSKMVAELCGGCVEVLDPLDAYED